ncbi:MAG: hypothetical protein WC595_06805 [Candidatus Nanoarchaeia archaeon]
MRIILTLHARIKMKVCGIGDEDIENAIRYGSKTKQTQGFLTCYTYYCVAYKIIGENTYKIKTIYLQK